MIRSLNIDDLDAFIQIRQDSLRLDPKSFGADSDKPLDQEVTASRLKAKNDEDFILAHFEEGKILGLMGFRRYQRNKICHKGMVWGVFVYPEHRGKGIANQLMIKLIEKAKTIEGLKKISLSAIHTSVASRSLYLKHGFKEWGVEKNAAQYKGEVLDEIFMDLPL